MNSKRILAPTLFAFLVAYAQAADDARSRLLAAQSLKCHFGPGTTAEWKGKEPAIRAARFDRDVQFDSIDISKRSARIIGNQGAGDVRVLNTAVGLTFLETGPGVFDVTTVFSAYTDDHEFPAVDSRHVTFLGKPMAEQYYGACRVWQ